MKAQEQRRSSPKTVSDRDLREALEAIEAEANATDQQVIQWFNRYWDLAGEQDAVQELTRKLKRPPLREEIEGHRVDAKYALRKEALRQLNDEYNKIEINGAKPHEQRGMRRRYEEIREIHSGLRAKLESSFYRLPHFRPPAA